MFVNRILQFVFLLVIAVLIPLKFNFSLLIELPILATVLYSGLSLFTQPYIDLSVDKNKRDDQYSVHIITLSFILCVSSAITEYTYFPNLFNFFPSYTIYLGYFLMLFGFLFRHYSLSLLGKYFSTQLEVKTDHELVKIGPYKYFRHPCYTGSHIGMIGNALIYPSLISLGLVLSLFTFAYLYRIYYEEKMLIKEFGDRYIEYKKETSALYPFL